MFSYVDIIPGTGDAWSTWKEFTMRAKATSLILGSLFVLGLGAGVQTQQPEHQHQQTPAKPSADMSAKCKAMMA